MSLDRHTITRGGTTKTLAEWGITGCVVRHRLGGEDEMILTATKNVDGSAIFDSGDELLLEDAGNANRFVGRVMKPRRSVRRGSEVHTYTVLGPWRYLQEETYQQPAKFAEDPEIFLAVVVAEDTARVILHRDPNLGDAWNMQEQVEDALLYAIAKGAPIDYDVAGVPTVQPPQDQALDQFVSDVVRRSMRWAPHIGCRWDYSGLVPELQFGDTVDGIEWETRTVDLSEMTDWDGTERYDLLCPVMEICYIGENATEQDGQRIKWLTIHRDVSTVANGANGRQVSTIVLRGAVWNGSEWTAAEPRPPDGLAASVHKAFSQLYYELSCTLQGDEVDWAYQPGERWNVTGATEGYASAQSVVQEIERDLAAGTVSIQAGPPFHLGLADRLAMMVPNRIRGMSSSAGESTYGMKPPETDDTPTGYTEIVLAAAQENEGGTMTAIRVKVMGDIVED